MPLIISYPNHIPDTVILAQEENTNNAEIVDWANDHETATTGVHGVGAGTIVGTANDNLFTGINTFNGPLRIYLTPGLVINAGVLTLSQPNGGFLGIPPTNPLPVYISVPNNAGTYDQLAFTSTTYCRIQDSTTINSYFYNGSAGVPWGTTSGRAWAEWMPLFVYVGTDGINPCMFLARKPNLTTTGLGGNIGYAENPPLSPSENNVFACTINNVTASHASIPITRIGAIKAAKNASNDWEFFPVTSYINGSGDRFESEIYNMPTGQNGADVGSYFFVSGGTGPIYVGTNFYQYSINRYGDIQLYYSFTNSAGGTVGAGTNPLSLSIPLDAKPLDGANRVIQGLNRVINAATILLGHARRAGASFLWIDNAATGGTVQGVGQNNATRSILGSAIYRV
jgi:hypothetical protein